MKIIKSAMLGTPGEAGLAFDLELINSFAKTALSQDEVYVFSVLLCDNEIDRDFERFSESAINELRELFVGKTGISDHDWATGNQKARIFRTEVVSDTDVLNSLGESYTFLRGWAYMLRTESTGELIAEIEGGIKREVSIGCSMGASLCSICGQEIDSDKCPHIRGREYGGKLCYAELTGAVDAYEWSFVAVPAQKNAGVLKAFEDDSHKAPLADQRTLKMAELGRRYLDGLKLEVKRLGLLADPLLGDALGRALDNMDEPELLAFKKSFECQLEGQFPPLTQLPGKGKATSFDSSAEYLV